MVTEIATTGWRELPISKLARFSRGVSWRKAEESNEGILVVSIPNIQDGHIDFNSKYNHYITKRVSENKKLQLDDIIFVGSSGSLQNVGRNAMVKELPTGVAAFASFAFNARPDRTIVDPRFLYYLCNSSQVPFDRYTKRAADGKYNFQLRDFEKNLKLSVPPILEQKAITQTLTSVHDAIAAQEELIAKLKELKRSMMNHLFTHGTKGEKTKMTDIGEIPESWDLVELIDVCDKPQYGFTDAASAKGNVRFLRITDITEDGVNWSTVPFCNCPEPEKYLLRDGDIVFARIGATTGKSFLLKDPDNAVYASYLIRVRTHSIDSAFLYQYFQTEAYWKQIDSQKGTNLKGGVNGSILSRLLVPKCSLAEQMNVADNLNFIDERIRAAQAKSSSYKSLLRTLLHELMSGERRVALPKTEEKQDPKEVFKDAFIQTYIIRSIPSPYVTHVRLEKMTYFTKRYAGVSPLSLYGAYTYGPYNPQNKYKGGLRLALAKKYIESGEHWGYKVGRNADQMKNYTYTAEVSAMRTALEKFESKSDNELEILATVDFSLWQLLNDKVKPTARLILDHINSIEVWKKKVQRLRLDENKINMAMDQLRLLAGAGLPYPQP
jgi:restriction endonuclease S subunit